MLTENSPTCKKGVGLIPSMAPHQTFFHNWLRRPKRLNGWRIRGKVYAYECLTFPVWNSRKKKWELVNTLPIVPWQCSKTSWWINRGCLRVCACVCFAQEKSLLCRNRNYTWSLSPSSGQYWNIFGSFFNHAACPLYKCINRTGSRQTPHSDSDSFAVKNS